MNAFSQCFLFWLNKNNPPFQIPAFDVPERCPFSKAWDAAEAVQVIQEAGRCIEYGSLDFWEVGYPMTSMFFVCLPT